MKIEFKPIYMIGVVLGILVVIADFYMFIGKDDLSGAISITSNFFWPLLILAINIMWSQFWIDFLKELQRQKRIEDKFLDFIRSLQGNIKSGIPIPQSIMQSSKDNYGELDPYIHKLANQISLGIPVHKALVTFSADTYNPTIKRAVGIIIEAEMSGGDIESVLASVTDSVVTERSMKEERKSSMYTQVVQGYAVYLIFIGIMVIMQKKLFPQLGAMSGGIGGGAAMSFSGMGSTQSNPEFLNKMFFALVIIQGFFEGLMIGKFSEGKLKSGLVHSIILVTLAALILTSFGVIGGTPVGP